MICSRCGTDKPDDPVHFPVFHGKRKGMVCRNCRNQRDGHQSPMAGICRHCHEPIIGRPKTTRYHTDPEHPACDAAHMEHLRQQQQSYDRGPGKAWRKARDGKSPRKKCTRCIALGLGKKSKPVKKGNYNFCDKHLLWASNVPEEYQGW